MNRGVLLHAIRLLRVRDASERVARGYALGLVVNFFPTFGFGVLISGFVARLFGGNAIAGVVGGATLTFVWPLLFFLNMRTGSLLFPPLIRVEEMEDVTKKTVDALVWGKTFMAGSMVNSALLGLSVYLLLRLIYARVRPGSLAWFRGHAREYRKKRIT